MSTPGRRGRDGRNPFTVLRCDGVSKSYDGAAPVTVLDGVDLHLRTGDVAVLLGPSGSGKSTLLSIIGGMLKPDAGSVRVAGVDLGLRSAAGRRAALRGRVGFVFQRFLLLPELSALENVVLGLRLAGLERASAGAAARELLERLGLEDRLGAPAGSLSFGEQQRVCIARALGFGPQLLLADEPTASLDWPSAERSLRGMLALAGGQRTAVLLATHDERLLPFATRVLRLEEGKMREETGPSPRAFSLRDATPPRIGESQGGNLRQRKVRFRGQ